MTWCPTGPLTFLPLHAAGLYSEPNGPRIFNHVVSSYIPSLTTLVESIKGTATPSPRVLAISQPSTPGQTRIPSTVTEVQRIQKEFPSDRFTWLNAESATIEAVTEEMGNHNWCHFACHGVQNRDDPTQSSFALHNGSLTLGTIMSKSFKSAELAFLSACQTATGDDRRPEEAVHLAAGMLIAGYSTVYATMWSVGDKDAPVVAENVYSALAEGSELQTDLRAHALHRAIQVLRNSVGENSFIRWVPFIHLGV